MAEGVSRPQVHIEVSNVGGIDEASVGFSPGVTVLAGRNATNRTSFLRSVMAALGSDGASLKGDADEGSVALELDGETYTRTLTRRDGTTVFGGSPYLEDAELADLFTFLLESNDARQAVERGADLYDVIMRPVDTDAIDDRIERRESERQALEAELGELASLEGQLPALEERRASLEAERDEKRDALEEASAELDSLDTSGGTPDELESRLEALREVRTELEDRRSDIADEEQVLEALRGERSDIESNLEGLATVDEGEMAEVEAELGQLRQAIQTIDSTLNDLQSVIQFNKQFIDGEPSAVLASVREELASETDTSVTDRLLAEGGEAVCWTCGSRVEQAEIERTLALLRDVHNEKIDERKALREQVNELEAERTHIERTVEDERRLRRRLEEVTADIDQRTTRTEGLAREVAETEASIEELEAEIDALETDDHDELLSLHREVNNLEFELDRLEKQLGEVDDEIASVEDRLEGRDALQEQLTEVEAEIASLRSRIDRLEREAVEAFNEQMDVVLDLLEYENLERVWIERLEPDGQEARGSERSAVFDVHVVRTTDAGSVYEDSIDHLSESEREVVGLVFALSGYLVHEVHEQVPFMLLDSLEAFDAARVAKLVDHFAQYADYLVVALLPEDAAALDDDYHRVTAI